ncbi:hypothetical protein [Shewanella surugensis]|uniref:Type III secretion system chaperone n=1 Tax=Shewanella surugensis TaxID=212020 RepID=A0ABT0LGQ6_9GAMM|nr:hypothetical protein [Shewanella surugensis]MCL1126522.1 hypothetical protein [Shewanella surugensis]
MDIFEEALSGLGVEIRFDREHLFSCELTPENETSGLYLSAYRDIEAMSLRLSVLTRNELHDGLNAGFWAEFSQTAIGPLRGGIGVGVLEGTKNICVYQVISLAGKPQDYAMQVIEQLIESAEAWDEKLSAF